jgi:hypothetical protein
MSQANRQLGSQVGFSTKLVRTILLSAFTANGASANVPLHTHVNQKQSVTVAVLELWRGL